MNDAQKYDVQKYDDQQKSIRELKRLSRIMDASIGIPGTKYQFGADALIGLIPGVGDFAGVIISLYIVARCTRLGLPKRLIARMIGNVILDGFVGTVPVAGDLFDVVFKANLRNVNAALEYLELDAEVSSDIQNSTGEHE
jgi:hypothetical protein